MIHGEILARHPFPWQKGGQNEAMCEILDANGWRVATVRGSARIVAGVAPPDDLAQFIIEAAGLLYLEVEQATEEHTP